MNFYKRFIGDYMRDTAKLSLTEHGAYNLLLDEYYSTEEPLPDNDDELFRVCRAVSKTDREAVMKVADKYFPVGQDGLRHKNRCDEEINAYGAKCETNSRIAVAREAARKDHEQSTNRATKRNTKRSTEQQPSQSQSQKELVPTANAVGAADAAPPCPHEQIIALYHELLPTCPRVAEWHDTRQGYLRARWRDKAKPNGVTAGYATVEAGLAWWLKFLGYCGDSKFLTGQVDGRDGKPPFVATLEWIIRPTNFSKIIEGNYHR